MKKLFVPLIAAFVVALSVIPAFATGSPAGYGYSIFQYDSIMDGAHYEWFNPTGDAAFFGVLPDKSGALLTFGSGLALDETTVEVTDVPESSVTDLTDDLAGKEPALPSGSSSEYIGGDKTLHAVPVSQAYEGVTQRLNDFPIFKSATVGSGVAVFYLTDDGTSSGTALFPNGVIQDSVKVTVNDAVASYQMSWAFTNSNKTLTVTTNKFTTANILSGILGQTAANGAVVKLSVWGY